MDIGKAIKELREAAGLTRPELAREVGMTTGALWKIEAGKVKAKDATARKVCQRLGISYARLVCLSLTAEDFLVE